MNPEYPKRSHTVHTPAQSPELGRAEVTDFACDVCGLTKRASLAGNYCGEPGGGHCLKRALDAAVSALEAEREGHRVTRTHFMTMRQLDADSRARLESELAETQSLLGVSASRSAIFEGERDASLARVSELERELAKANEANVTVGRIVRRALTCGQLEKLDDARPYLTNAEPWSTRIGSVLPAAPNATIDASSVVRIPRPEAVTLTGEQYEQLVSTGAQPTPSPSGDNPDTYVDDASAAWDDLPESIRDKLAKPSFIAGYNHRGTVDAIARQGALPAGVSEPRPYTREWWGIQGGNCYQEHCDKPKGHNGKHRYEPESPTDEPAPGSGEPESMFAPDTMQKAWLDALQLLRDKGADVETLLAKGAENIARCYEAGTHINMKAADWDAMVDDEPASEPEAPRAVVVGQVWRRRDTQLTATVTRYDQRLVYLHHDTVWAEEGFRIAHEWVSNPPSETTGEKT